MASSLGRNRVEAHSFKKEQIDEIVKQYAKMMIVGRIFFGEIGEQAVMHDENGGITVLTTVREDKVL
jgi:hypothetical protein